MNSDCSFPPYLVWSALSMSAIPSLSIWSSVKILLPRRNGKETKRSVPYVDSCNRIKQIHKNDAKTAREVISLRVPSPLLREKENSHPNICQDFAKKRRSRKGPRNISHVTVPDIQPFESKENSAYHRHKRPSCKEFYGGKRSSNFDQNFPDSDDDLEVDCIPSVKPWTPEELRMLNKRYNLTEEQAKKEEDKTKRKDKRKVKISKGEQKTPQVLKTPNSTSCSDAYKCRKSLSQILSCHFDSRNLRGSFPLGRVKQTGRDYYEMKLAELYMIELGIK